MAGRRRRTHGVCSVCKREIAVAFNGETWHLYRHGLPECAGSRTEPTAIIRAGR